jgi:Ca2+:H+ antiporter
VILLIVYGCYLFFQLKTHSSMYNEPSQKVPKRVKEGTQKGNVISQLGNMGARHGALGAPTGQDGMTATQPHEGEEEDEAEEPQLSLIGAFVTLGACTVLVALCAEYMVDSIDYITEDGGLPKTFVSTSDPVGTAGPNMSRLA